MKFGHASIRYYETHTRSAGRSLITYKEGECFGTSVGKDFLSHYTPLIYGKRGKISKRAKRYINLLGFFRAICLSNNATEGLLSFHGGEEKKTFIAQTVTSLPFVKQHRQCGHELLWS